MAQSMGDAIIQEIGIDVDIGEADDQFKALSKGYQRVVDDMNKISNSVGTNIRNMTNQISNATKSVNFGVTLKSEFNRFLKSFIFLYIEFKYSKCCVMKVMSSFSIDILYIYMIIK